VIGRDTRFAAPFKSCNVHQNNPSDRRARRGQDRTCERTNSHRREVPEGLRKKRILSLDLGALIAGAKFRGR
jgi:hypothetical protein